MKVKVFMAKKNVDCSYGYGDWIYELTSGPQIQTCGPPDEWIIILDQVGFHLEVALILGMCLNLIVVRKSEEWG